MGFQENEMGSKDIRYGEKDKLLTTRKNNRKNFKNNNNNNKKKKSEKKIQKAKMWHGFKPMIEFKTRTDLNILLCLRQGL